MSNYSFDVVCDDINTKIIALAKEGQSYLCYDTSDIRLGIVDKLIETLKSYGYSVVDGYYGIEISW